MKTYTIIGHSRPPLENILMQLLSVVRSMWTWQYSPSYFRSTLRRLVPARRQQCRMLLAFANSGRVIIMPTCGTSLFLGNSLQLSVVPNGGELARVVVLPPKSLHAASKEF